MNKKVIYFLYIFAYFCHFLKKLQPFLALQYAMPADTPNAPLLDFKITVLKT